MVKLELQNARLAKTPWFYATDGHWWLMWSVLPQVGKLVEVGADES